uniref:Putative bpti/kunitz family of serine protease inhibitor n=1 Tax=Amblyomma tuberculatum TaxID=48802 RepID=A0A6M2E485_9ACAR
MTTDLEIKMHFLSFLLAACTLATSALTGRATADHFEKAASLAKCQTPIMEQVPGCGANVIRFYYDEKNQTCKSFIWNGCLLSGVFNLLHDCVSECNKGQSVPFCSGEPVGICAESSSSGQGDMMMTMMRRKAYFYNATSHTCEEYEACRATPPTENENYFPTKTNCELQCRGF